MPPARCTSSMWTFGVLGRDLGRQHPAGDASMSADAEAQPASRAGGQRCSTVWSTRHGHVQRHRVLERLRAGDLAGRTVWSSLS